ncbi:MULTISPECIES: GAF and ANTAR domain-containing protein [unclassified Plantibacter]|jgi:GAF domain-containing protein|uniref:GAF and ANTAR domain-containing protein n=1 Tax=unclassified Plantibacter TaxID=2624265 RepID=UPI003D32DD61
MNEAVATWIADIALELQAEPDVDATVQAVAEYAKSALECDDVGILMITSGVIETAAATSDRVREADDLQRELGEGPCLSSLESHETYIIDEILTDPRWPVWGPKVAALGFRSCLSVQLFTRDRGFGSLNLFSDEPAFFTEDDESVGEIFARHASVALAAARQEDGLLKAIDGRKLIGQAEGILMERFNIDADRAFAVLNRYSQHHNMKLRAVAERIVTNGQLPGVASGTAAGS